MAGAHKPGPWCSYNDPVDIEDGTMCRALSPIPGPICSSDFLAPEALFTSAYPYGFPRGRIPVGERTDPGPDGLVDVNRYGQDPKGGQRVFQLTPETLEAFRGMRSAAAGQFDTELFTLKSAYRSSSHQAGLARAARKRYGSKGAASRWVAQGRSEHITGRAFDLNLGIKNSSENAESGAFDELPAYQWLKQNARFFGLSPYPREPWHWSYNPTK